jgi:hypothetical protein
MSDEILQKALITTEIPKARESVQLLEKLGLLEKNEAKDLQLSIDELEKQNFVFITKPFRNHDATGLYMYRLMKSRIEAFEILLKKDEYGR